MGAEPAEGERPPLGALLLLPGGGEVMDVCSVRRFACTPPWAGVLGGLPSFRPVCQRGRR